MRRKILEVLAGDKGSVPRSFVENCRGRCATMLHVQAWEKYHDSSGRADEEQKSHASGVVLRNNIIKVKRAAVLLLLSVGAGRVAVERVVGGGEVGLRRESRQRGDFLDAVPLFRHEPFRLAHPGG